MTKMTHLRNWVLLAAILCVPAARGQQNDPVKNELRERPVSPFAPILASANTGDSALDTPQLPTTDVPPASVDRPLSGVQELTSAPTAVGIRNYLVPSVIALSQLGTNYSRSGFDRPTTASLLVGMLDLNHVSERSELLLHYSGGGTFSNYLNSAIQDLDFSYNYKWRRWSLLVGDEGNFLSESPFGFAGIGGLAFLNGLAQNGFGGANGTFLSSFLGPNQTIPTIIAPRVSNTAVSQLEYTVSPRSSWTASGSFGTLNFLQVGFINSYQSQFQTGYNYLLDPQSSVALIYRFTGFQFAQLPQSIQDHVAQLGYGRYLTGRLSFQVAAGPSIEVMQGPVTGSSNRLSWALDGSLNYQMDRTAIMFFYDHIVTGGSGVFVGAQTSQAEATLQRKISPKWQASVSMGYATNHSLIPLTTDLGAEPLNSWYLAARFNHQLRPGASLFLSYGVRRQVSAAPGCTTSGCATNSIGHEVSAGFNFAMRPILFR